MPCIKKEYYKTASLHLNIKLKWKTSIIISATTKKMLVLILVGKSANYRLRMAEITQNRQKCLIFIFKEGKTLIRLHQKEENSTLKINR